MREVGEWYLAFSNHSLVGNLSFFMLFSNVVIFTFVVLFSLAIMHIHGISLPPFIDEAKQDEL